MEIFPTVAEAALQQEVNNLKRKVRRLEWKLEGNLSHTRDLVTQVPGGVMEMKVPHEHTLKMAATWRVETDSPDGLGVHIRGQTWPTDRADGYWQHSYFIGRHEVLSARNSLVVLGDCHLRVIRALSSEWSKIKS